MSLAFDKSLLQRGMELRTTTLIFADKSAMHLNKTQ